MDETAFSKGVTILDSERELSISWELASRDRAIAAEVHAAHVLRCTWPPKFGAASGQV